MARFYIDTFNSVAAMDEEGQEFGSLDDLRKDLRESLAAMMRDEHDGRRHAQLRADARDESGRRVMTATLLLVIEDAEDYYK